MHNARSPWLNVFGTVSGMTSPGGVARDPSAIDIGAHPPEGDAMEWDVLAGTSGNPLTAPYPIQFLVAQ